MATLNSEVRHKVRVTVTAGGAPVTGLTPSGFAFTLRRRTGPSFVSSAEPVTSAEIGAGEYWVFYTPTLAATLYVLNVAPASGLHTVAPTTDGATRSSEWQDDVQPASTAPSGPYLTTRAAFKAAVEIQGTRYDAAIDAMLPQVTDMLQTLCDRTFAQAAGIVEYPYIRGNPIMRLFLKRPPVSVALTSFYLSWSWPRVYDATTILVEGTDFVVEESTGIVELVVPRFFSGDGTLLKAAKVTYTGGFATIPGDIERAAQEVMDAKLQKAFGHQYHLTSASREDGSVGGIRFDDLPPNALDVVERYRLRPLL